MYILSDTVCIVPLAVGGAQFIFTENARGLGNRTKSPFPLHISLPGMNLSAKLSNQASVSESYLYTLRDLDQPTFFSVFLLNDSLTFIIENESPTVLQLEPVALLLYIYTAVLATSQANPTDNANEQSTAHQLAIYQNDGNWNSF